MARPEQCSGCEKKTTIHFTQIINNKVYKLDMCEDCPFKKEIIDPGNFSLTDIFKADMQKSTTGFEEVGEVICESCGFTQADFEKRGRLGCPDCYDYFEAPIRTLIKDMHYGSSHQGKKPKLAVKRVDLAQRMTQLREELNGAVLTEDYENAAQIRDQILELEAQLVDLTESSG